MSCGFTLEHYRELLQEAGFGTVTAEPILKSRGQHASLAVIGQKK